MTVDPHQIHNLISPAFGHVNANSSLGINNEEILPLIHRLSKLLAKLGDCVGSECYGLEDPVELSLNQSHTTETKRALWFESMQSSIRNRIPCHNPVNVPLPLANGRPIPEPFTYGFPFSDEENVEEDLLRLWEAYEHFFYS